MPGNTPDKPASHRDGRHHNANAKRPARSPSAVELIAQATAARATLNGHQPGPSDKAPAGNDLPTIKELEEARDDHKKKIATEREADGRAREAHKKARAADGKDQKSKEETEARAIRARWRPAA
jgi:hypothetical protein